jgi:hypothetical protein
MSCYWLAEDATRQANMNIQLLPAQPKVCDDLVDFCALEIRHSSGLAYLSNKGSILMSERNDKASAVVADGLLISEEKGRHTSPASSSSRSCWRRRP